MIYLQTAALSVGAYLALKDKENLSVSKEKAKLLLTDDKFITSVSTIRLRL